MSLATLNKQRTTEKQQAQSIKTTVTISSVSKTAVGSTTPVTTQSKKITFDSTSVKSGSSHVSPQVVQEESKTIDAQAVEEILLGKNKEQAKEKFMNEGLENAQRRGEQTRSTNKVATY